MLSTGPAFANTAIELTDKRAEQQNGLQLIYEVRFLSHDSAKEEVESNRIHANRDLVVFSISAVGKSYCGRD